jgi:ribulose-phosphate 3-epimerase
MAEIVPAILEQDLNSFEAKITEIIKIPQLKRVQIDISDGIFTPTKTVQLSELDLLSPVLFWEAHLMVQNPRDYLLDAKIAGFNLVTIHFESVAKEMLSGLAEEIRNYKLAPALAVKPETPIENVYEYLQYFDQILIFSDANLGFQGGGFVEETHKRVQEVKKRAKNVIIEVDGGVKLSNARRLVDDGADLLAVGSALTAERESYSISQNFERFEIEIKK